MAPDLDFKVLGARPEPFCATPMLALELEVSNAGGEPIHSLSLHCQIRIEAQRRRYLGPERERLFDLFGEPERWSQTLRSLLWTNVDCNLRGFNETTRQDLLVPCTYDFNVLAARYLHAVEGGTVPVTLLFSGTIFYAGEDSSLQVSMVSWSKEATFELEVQVWKAMMDEYYPNSAWLCLPKGAFDRLAAYKSRRGLATWDQALDQLLEAAGEPAAS